MEANISVEMVMLSYGIIFVGSVCGDEYNQSYFVSRKMYLMRMCCGKYVCSLQYHMNILHSMC